MSIQPFTGGEPQARPPQPRATKPTLAALAKATLADNEGDVAKTVQDIIRKIKKSKTLLEAIVTEAVELAVDVHVAIVHRRARQRVVNSIHHLNALTDVVESMLLDFPLAGGLRLRDATREQILAQADVYSRQIGDMAHKESWLRNIAEYVPDDETSTVGDALNEEQVRHLWEKCNG